MDQQSFFSGTITDDRDTIFDSQISLGSPDSSRNSATRYFKGLQLSGSADQPPPQLEQSHRGLYVVWTEETADVFEAWFNNTPFVQAVQGHNEQPRKWFLPMWNTKRRRAIDSAWSHFHEATDVHHGVPKLICKYCRTVQNHPDVKKEGTSNMSRHLQSTNCNKSGKRSAEAQNTLERHFKKVCKLPADEEGSAKTSSLISDYTVLWEPASTGFVYIIIHLNILQSRSISSEASSIPVFTQPAFQNALVYFILDANIPFRTLERPSFQALLQMCRPSIQLPGRTHLQKLIADRATAARKQILKQLPSSRKISLALDCWTSPNRLAFLAILGYFITDNWEYKEVLLAFHPLVGKHSGKTLARLVTTTLHEYQISSQLLALTADNASNNQRLRKELERNLRKEGIIWNSDAGTIRCMAHVIQLAVKQFLSVLKSLATNKSVSTHLSATHLSRIQPNYISFSNTLSKIRALSVAVNSSPQQLEAFKSIQDPDDRAFRDPKKSSSIRVGLIQDVKTRWGSVYNMLERAWEMKIAIHKWINLDMNRFRYSVLQLKEEEWTLVDDLLNILQPFSIITSAIGTTLEVSVHQMFQLYNWLFEQLEKVGDIWRARAHRSKHAEELVRAIDAAREKLAEYYGKTDGVTGTFYNLATILNPSTKLSLYEVGITVRLQSLFMRLVYYHRA
jgi:hypothetical protein